MGGPVLLKVKSARELLRFCFSFSQTLLAGGDKKKAANTLKVSDKEKVEENQIKGEGHLWCTSSADTAL